MKPVIAVILNLYLLSISLSAQTKRYSFNYPSEKDSTGNIIYKQGLTDASGKIVIYPFYDYINWDESLNLAMATISDKNKTYYTGYIDSLGFIKIPFKYKNLSWFNEDKIARFFDERPKNNGLGLGNYGSLQESTEKVYGFININGAEILNNIVDNINYDYGYDGPEFSESYIAISKTIVNTFTQTFEKDSGKRQRNEIIISYGNKQYIYYDKFGKPALKGINNSSEDSLMFIKAKPFYKGLAAVKYPGANWKKENRYKRVNDYCLINKAGKIIVPPKYYEIDYFYQGTPRVAINDTVAKKILYGLIDSTGKEIVAPRYRSLENLYEGYVQVAIDDDKSPNKRLWGIVDKKTGKEVVPCKYERVGSFYEGMAAVMQGGRWGFVNLKGEMVIPPKYIKASNSSIKFSEGLAVVTTDTTLNKKYGAIDKTGKTIIPFIYDDLNDYTEGLALANKGKTMKQGQYNWQRNILATGKYGYINKNGKTVIPLEYDYGSYFNKGYAIVIKDSIRFSIDINGKNTLAAAPRILYAYNAGLIELNKKDYKSALKYLSEASAGGYTEADYSLGLMYYVGTDVTPKNTAETVKIWYKAAIKNCAIAQYALGSLYGKGDGVPLNTNEAISWFKKSAALNNPDALCDLGILNENGQWGLPVNLTESIKYYTQAANLGNPRGIYLIGLAYYNGKGVAKNMQTCRTWWEKAAAKNYRPAQDALKQYGGMLK